MQKIVVGNWKMNKTTQEASVFLELFFQKNASPRSWVGIAPPFTALTTVSTRAHSSFLHVGAQNVYARTRGAFTGEVSAEMVKEAGASFVILGHSERRHLLNETDTLIRKKVVAALEEELTVLLCIGETAPERAEGKTEEVLAWQLTSALQELPVEFHKQVQIAYEPVWAIGAGTAAQPEQILAVEAFCRNTLKTLLSATEVPFLYGGSVTPQNVESLLASPAIHGVLVGGASLDPVQFSQLIEAIDRL